MAESKKYYYLKLKDNFFDTDAMIILEAMPDGYLYSNILLKLYLRSLKNEGKLMFKDIIPYNTTMLAQVTRHNVGVVEKALDIFQRLGLIEVLDNGAIYMSDIQNFIGKSSTEADRKRDYRNRIESEKSSESLNGTNVQTNLRQISEKSPPEIEIEIEKEINKEINNSTGSSGESLPEPPPPKEPIFISLPMLGKEPPWPVTLSYLQQLKTLYPGVDVEKEIRNMYGWLDSRPKQRKTPKGIKRFITGWLAREQDRGGRYIPRKNQQKTGFTDCSQRNYDFNELEKLL